MALCVHVEAVRAGARGTNEERARRGIRRIPLCRARRLEALLRVEAAYAEVLETPGHVLNEDILIRAWVPFLLLVPRRDSHGDADRRYAKRDTTNWLAPSGRAYSRSATRLCFSRLTPMERYSIYISRTWNPGIPFHFLILYATLALRVSVIGMVLP
jgi:hypothetical protein